MRISFLRVKTFFLNLLMRSRYVFLKSRNRFLLRCITIKTIFFFFELLNEYNYSFFVFDKRLIRFIILILINDYIDNKVFYCIILFLEISDCIDYKFLYISYFNKNRFVFFFKSFSISIKKNPFSRSFVSIIYLFLIDIDSVCFSILI